MKKLIVRNFSGEIIDLRTGDDFSKIIEKQKQRMIWGKPERWVLHKDEQGAEPYEEADVLEEETVESTDGPAQKMVKLKAQYTIEIEDITAQVAQEAINAEALAYLASTDWLIIREVDAGVPCPEDIKQKRAEARAKILR
jgi:hypothetical protein